VGQQEVNDNCKGIFHFENAKTGKMMTTLLRIFRSGCDLPYVSV